MRSRWGAGVITLQITALYLVYSAYEYTVYWPGVSVFTLASLTVFLITPCTLLLDACVPIT